MSEIGELRQQDNSGDTISSGVIINELDLVNKLLARAEKAEAALESAQKMCDHWEVKAGDWKFRAEKREADLRNRANLIWSANTVLDAADTETHHPANAIGERKPMTLGERVQWLVESRDDWKRIASDNEARAEKTEVERDELKRRAENAEAKIDELKQKLSRSEADRRELQSQNGRMRFDLKSYGSTIQPEQSRLVKEWKIVNPVDWQRVRIDAAIAMIQGMWACPDTNFKRPMEEIAVECADALVAELQRKEVQG